MNAIKPANLGFWTLLVQVALAPLAAAQPASTPSPSSAQGTFAASLPPPTRSALKLAGLVTFVANACPKLKPDYPRFEAAIAALGVTKSDLDRADMKAGYLGYAARYNTDVEGNCARAEKQFGLAGKTLSGIFVPR